MYWFLNEFLNFIDFHCGMISSLLKLILYLSKDTFNWVELWCVGWKITNRTFKLSNFFFDWRSMMNSGIIHDQHFMRFQMIQIMLNEFCDVLASDWPSDDFCCLKTFDWNGSQQSDNLFFMGWKMDCSIFTFWCPSKVLWCVLMEWCLIQKDKVFEWNLRSFCSIFVWK